MNMRGSMSSHPQTCRCGRHTSLTPIRHARYEQLARAILGPLAPSDGLALARAFAEHAHSLAAARRRARADRRGAA